MRNRLVLALVAAIAFLTAGTAHTGAQSPATNVILVTLDGARVQEIFGGLDEAVLRSMLREGERLEDQAVYKRFNADTPEARRRKLMPFLWDTLLERHGWIAGNAAAGSTVTLTNTHRFSYPGYSEILLGEAHDDVIKSNDGVQNPYVTVLEELATRLGLPPAKAAVFGSWEVFNAIAEHRPGTMTINAGFEAFQGGDDAIRRMSDLQWMTPTPWDSVRHDVYTFRFAMAHLASARPRLLYLALGETDDWAHDGRYDRVLESFARSDAFLAELWAWVQSQPDYKDRTHLVITTDHGRGRTTADWREHGARVEGAQDVWVAVVSPAITARGERRDHAPLHTNQIAATIAGWMGVDWKALRPSAGLPLR